MRLVKDSLGFLGLADDGLFFLEAEELLFWERVRLGDFPLLLSIYANGTTNLKTLFNPLYIATLVFMNCSGDIMVNL